MPTPVLTDSQKAAWRAGFCAWIMGKPVSPGNAKWGAESALCKALFESGHSYAEHIDSAQGHRPKLRDWSDELHAWLETDDATNTLTPAPTNG